MIVRIAGLSQQGAGRSNNEDSIYFDEQGLLLVADGMGGALAGEIASNTAVEVISQSLAATADCRNMPEVLCAAVYQANERIYQDSLSNPAYAGMATTVTLAKLQNQTLYLAHVGDSRAYLIRQNSISQLTQDHSVVQELVQGGGITAAEASKHPQKNILTRAVGAESLVEVDELSVEMQAGDIAVLCSDGLSGIVAPNEILTAVEAATDQRAAAEALVNLACALGGHDDISVLVACFDGEVE